MIHAITEKLFEMTAEQVLFHQAVADVLGLHVTDHKCLDIIHRLGPVPAGKLAELTGLTTGAVTGIIDRLEKAGYVRRTSDPDDRRKTIVEPTEHRILQRKIGTVFQPFHEGTRKLLTPHSDTELAFLLDLTTEFVRLTREQTKKLRDL